MKSETSLYIVRTWQVHVHIDLYPPNCIPFQAVSVQAVAGGCGRIIFYDPTGRSSLAIGHAQDWRICRNRRNHCDCSVNLDQLVSGGGAAAACHGGRHQEEDGQNVQSFSYEHDWSVCTVME